MSARLPRTCTSQSHRRKSRYEPPQGAEVYLCDGETAEYLTGEVGSETTMLEGKAPEVELSLANEDVTGAVTLDGEEPRPFTAHQASGVAGLYMAAFTFESYEYRPHWVVLPDDSQRGQASWVCCTVHGCKVCTWTTTS